MFCLALLFRVVDLREMGKALDEEFFALSENRELFRRWRDDAPPSEEESELWEHYQGVLATSTPQIDMGQARPAFLNCVARLERARMRSVKEASALALVEGEAGVRPGQVASIARARLEAGQRGEAIEDETAEAVASLLLEDTEAGLRLFNPRFIEDSHSDQTGRRSTQ